MLTIKEMQLGRSYEIADDNNPDGKVVLDFVNAANPGILTNEVLLFVLIKRLKSLNLELACEENEKVIELLMQAVDVLAQRAQRMKQAFGQAIGIAQATPAPEEHVQSIPPACVKTQTPDIPQEFPSPEKGGDYTAEVARSEPASFSQGTVEQLDNWADKVERTLERDLPKSVPTQGPSAAGLLGQLEAARSLLTETHALGSPEVKELIERRTGRWLVWGVDQHEKPTDGEKTC